MSNLTQQLDEQMARRRQTTAALIQRLGGAATPRQVSRHLWRYRHPHQARSLLQTMVNRGMGQW